MSMASLQKRPDFATEIIYAEFKGKVWIQTFYEFESIDQALWIFGR